jgi:hypothetical protein
MNPMEDLLRHVFAERALEVTQPPPLPAPSRRSRAPVILAGTAAVVVVLVGSTLTFGHLRSDTPTPPAKPTLRFTPAPITSAHNRTSAVIDWAPTVTPEPPSGYEVTTNYQARIYGFENTRFAAVAIGRGSCASLRRTGTTQVVLRWEQMVTNAGSVVCRALPGGGTLAVAVGGAVSDATEQAGAVADSVRPGRRDEVVLPVSLPAGSAPNRLTVTAPYEARTRWAGNITGSGGADLYIGPPPETPQPNQTLGGRPAQVNDYGSTTMVRIMLSPTVYTNVIARTHAQAVAIGAGLRLGAVPEYPWVH